ncbi:MAG: HlyD family efflux transporter periplasmic adaptor subunit [Pseudomonadota bacterium]
MTRTSPENLFRLAAIEALSEQSLGRTISRVPRVWSWLTLSLVLVFVAAALLAPRIEWHRTEGVRGWLVPDAGIVHVASPSAGIVIEHSTGIGQQVEAGEVLARLTSELRDSDGKSIQGKDRQLVEAALKEISERQRLLAHHYALRLDRAKAKARLMLTERDSMDRQIGFEQRRQQIESRRLATLKSAGQSVPAWELSKQEEVLAGRQSGLESLRQARARLNRELKLVEADVKGMPIEAALARSDLSTEQTRLQRELGISHSEFALVAPVAGQVADVSLAVGDIVQPGVEVISILPEGARLQAELHVPSHSAANLKQGQAVRLFIDAWPREKFGAIGGTVDRVAEFVGSSETGSANGTYRVIVRIEDSGRALRPGMSLGAELLLERRDLIDWIVGPLRSRFSS